MGKVIIKKFFQKHTLIIRTFKKKKKKNFLIKIKKNITTIF